jgi:hypothetical protein
MENNIKCILKKMEGFVWLRIGTNGGLPVTM